MKPSRRVWTRNDMPEPIQARPIKKGRLDSWPRITWCHGVDVTASCKGGVWVFQYDPIGLSVGQML